MRLTTDELAALPAKTKKHADVVALYIEYDFMTAYAMHTDKRVLVDGPQSAVGAVKDWERHGELQLAFLIARGLQRDTEFLEIGCGTGRLARKLVPWLDDSRYSGVDISKVAIDAAALLARTEGWADKHPLFQTEVPFHRPVDIAWAFSVFIHLPRAEIVRTMRTVHDVLRPGGCFYFSYVPEQRDERTGLKQFRHTLSTWKECVAEANFISFAPITEWPGEQKVALVRRGA